MLQYNFLSREIASLSTRILKIPAMGHFGDFGEAPPLSLAEEALLAFTKLNEILGLSLKLPKSEWGRIIEFLGLILDLSPFPDSPPALCLPKLQRDGLATTVDAVLSDGKVSLAAIQNLFGELAFTQAATLGKIGRALLRPLCLFVNSAEAPRRLSSVARKSLLRLSSVVLKIGPRATHLTNSSTDVVIYADAAESGGCAALAFFLDSEDSRP